MSAESWAVGQHHVLFSKSTGAVALGNASAAMVWNLFVETAPGKSAVRELASLWRLDLGSTRRVIDELLETWRSAGLFPTSHAIETANSEPFPPLQAGYEFAYQTTSGRFRITSEDFAFAEVMDAVLAPLAAACASTDRDCRIDIRGCAENYLVIRDGRAISGPENIALARYAVLQELIAGDAQQYSTSAVLHASAVSFGDRAVIIAGESGSGKSTLTGGLVYEGAGYIGDDLVPLSRDGSRIGAFPVALSVKKGAWETLQPLYPEHLWSAPLSINGYVLRYIDLTFRATAEQTFPVAAIVFPKYRPSAQVTLERMTPEATLQHLLNSGSRTVGADPTIEGLCRLVNTTPAYRLVHGDWRTASEALAGVL